MALKWILANDANDKIDKGQITINQNTTFTGDATFLSKGTDESITINSGSIVFKRNDIPLTTIKNIRFGSITTDYNGKGRVSFEGFKKPILILSSIKSFTSRSGSNIASLYCYTEEIDSEKNTYKFILRATSEYHTPPTDIKVMSKHVTIENSIGHTWKDFGFECSEIIVKGNPDGNNPERRRIGVSFYKYPQYRIVCNQYINGIKNEIFRKDFVVKPSIVGADVYYANDWSLTFYKDTIRQTLNKFYEYARSTVDLEFEITILEPNIGMNAWSGSYTEKVGSGGNATIHTYWTSFNKKEVAIIDISKFYNYFITYSYEMSQISDPYGEGEVQYIAMEIDDR